MASISRNLHPLEVNPDTNEVYLRLPPPYINIIITPPRPSDAPIIVKYLNDSRVYKTLDGPPYPYLLEHAESWLSTVSTESADILSELNGTNKQQSENEESVRFASLPYVDGCPVRALREVQEDGTDLFIGDITITRCGRFDYIRDKTQETKLVSYNESLSVGDPNIIWEFGDYLAASHHGRGIMTAAMRTILHSWAIPRMNTKRIFGFAFKGNIGSVKVFEKNGFKLFDTVDDCVTIGESKGGGKMGMHCLEWRGID